MSQEDHNPSSSQVGNQAERNEHLQQSTQSSNPRGSDTSVTSNGTGVSSQFARAQQPINDAVTSAFHNTQSPLSPELLSQLTSQITASVLLHLRDQNLPTPAIPVTIPTSNENHDTSSSIGSPPLDRAKVYTPPSPYRASEEAAQTQTSPKMPPPPGQPTYGHASPPRRDLSPLTKMRTVNEADMRESKLERPSPPKRLSTGGDTTVLEKIWGKLFDPQGLPTVRLGQFLRGIAVHLIEDYEPRHSLVVTPTKMQKYYEDTRIANEIYPWHLIFDDRTSSISRLFRDLSIQHHLVQDVGRHDERPDIPGLTPLGFEVWATLVIRAHPDQEFERLAKTVLDMPINNPDDLKERFPKELSRRLFPKDGDTHIASRLRKPINVHCGVNIPSRTSSNADQASGPPVSSQQTNDAAPSSNPASAPQQPSKDSKDSSTHLPPPPASGNRVSFSKRLSQHELDQLHATTSHARTAADASVIDEEDESGQTTPHPIERERKPYSAQPGGGKSYEAPPSSNASDKYESMSDSGEPKLKRTTSASKVPRSRTNPIAVHNHNAPPQPEPLDLHRTKSNSSYQRDAPSRYNRNRSPSAGHTSDHGRWNEPDVLPGSYQSNSLQDGYRSAHGDRYDHRDRAQSIYDTRDSRYTDREPRSRYKSVSAADNYHPSGDEYYRSSGNNYSAPNGGQYVPASPSYSQYPQSSYKDNR